ncbi:MAG TPA: hypothetical protein VFN10_11425 [Thermoanaerobaculia bacterium]|nr:hypothetical protein [Thermoanaerobaculia bacterium]
MITPSGMAIAAITVMLWILWSDTIRARRPAPILYAVRIALYIIVAGVLIVNMVRYPYIFDSSARTLAIVAVVIGLGGAAYFGKKLVTRTPSRPQQ